MSVFLPQTHTDLHRHRTIKIFSFPSVSVCVRLWLTICFLPQTHRPTQTGQIKKFGFLSVFVCVCLWQKNKIRSVY